MTTPGWARPLKGRPMHYWRADGKQLCLPKGFSYVGPKLDPQSVLVADVCTDCFKTLAHAADLVGLSYAQLVDLLQRAGDEP